TESDLMRAAIPILDEVSNQAGIEQTSLNAARQFDRLIARHNVQHLSDLDPAIVAPYSFRSHPFTSEIRLPLLLEPLACEAAQVVRLSVHLDDAGIGATINRKSQPLGLSSCDPKPPIAAVRVANPG